MPEFPGVDRGVGAERSIRRHAGRFGPTADKPLRKGRLLRRGSTTTCKCPKCGYEEPKISGVRCEQLKCPECGSIMTGK